MKKVAHFSFIIKILYIGLPYVLNSHQGNKPFNCFRGNCQLFNLSHEQSMLKSYPLWNKAEKAIVRLS